MQGVGMGNGAIDPSNGVGDVGVAHEVAHALGLADAYTMDAHGNITKAGPPGNLMSAPMGEKLTSEDCKRLWAKLAIITAEGETLRYLLAAASSIFSMSLGQVRAFFAALLTVPGRTKE